MRTIKFRGKTRKEGKWVYGNFELIHVVTDTFYVDSLAVSSETVGQFTGLYDKNGKEIYEGDIVLVSKIANAKIVWDNVFACFGFDYGESGKPLAVDLTTDKSIEVIGNEIDNPELLKEQGK